MVLGIFLAILSIVCGYVAIRWGVLAVIAGIGTILALFGLKRD